MNALRIRISTSLVSLLAAIAITPATAQVPVDDSGAPLADYESFEPDARAGNEDIPLLTRAQLQELVGPIALYPDDLLAIVLPASTYPLQLVQAQRFLDDVEQDPSLKPDGDWDDSVIALLNYPEVVALLNEDLDWTWRLGEAVVAQQADVVSAVESFRDRAYAAGNLKSDSHQTVARNDGSIEITPVEDDVIYVPYYEPERVVVYQPRPVYHYYPRAYPVYYYPYPVGYAFNSGFFWGVTTAFTVGWVTDSVHVIHHSYHGHPYYGRHYWDGWWYRRPTIHVHNHYYSPNRYAVSHHRYSRGDHWRPRHETRRRLDNQRIARSNYYTGQRVQHRSYTGTAARRVDARVQPARRAERSTAERHRGVRTTTAERSTAERHRKLRTTTTERRREAQRAAEPVARGAAPRRETRARQSVDRRQASYAQRQQSRPERVARRDSATAERRNVPRASEQRRQRATTEYRQERHAASPRREQPRQSRQQPVREKKRAQNSERSRHASSRDDSKRRQRH